MMSPSQNRLAVLLLSSLWLGLDQAAKIWIQQVLAPSQSIPVWPNIFHLTLVFNTGAAFSLFEQYPSLLLVLTGILFIAILALAMTRIFTSTWEILAFSLILGGALGNIADRIQWGKVIDYFDVICIHYPVFNLADSFIFIGVCILMLLQFKAGLKD